MFEEVKKFKNGKIALKIDKKHGWYIKHDKLSEAYYHDVMFMSDLYINQINGYQYLVDFNTQTVYSLGTYLMQNPLQELLDNIFKAYKEGKAYYLYPLTKEESKSLLQDLENGY